MDNTPSQINYLIKFIDVNCEDITWYIQFLYIRLIRNEYFVLKLRQLMNNDVTYGFKITDEILDIIGKNQNVNTEYIIQSVADGRKVVKYNIKHNLNPKCLTLIVKKYCDVKYGLRVIIENYFNVYYLNFSDMTEIEFEQLMLNLIDIVELYSYQSIYIRHCWIRDKNIPLLSLIS